MGNKDYGFLMISEYANEDWMIPKYERMLEELWNLEILKRQSLSKCTVQDFFRLKVLRNDKILALYRKVKEVIESRCGLYQREDTKWICFSQPEEQILKVRYFLSRQFEDQALKVRYFLEDYFDKNRSAIHSSLVTDPSLIPEKVKLIGLTPFEFMHKLMDDLMERQT